MRIVLIFLLTALLRAGEVHIASYNVENLFDLNFSGKEYKQYTPSIDGWNISAYRTKIGNISTVISELSPHIIALQEIENENVLKKLKEQCNKRGCRYKYYLFGEGQSSRSSIGVALLSEYPLTLINRHEVRVGEKGRSRNILECDADTPIGKIRLLVTHWPSKRNREAHRVDAAAVLKRIIDTLPPGCEYVVIGDFNSSYDEASRLLTENMDNTGGVTGINHYMKTTLASPGTPFRPVTAAEVKSAGRGFHYNPWAELSGYDQFSYRFRGEFNTLDHILVPSTLLDSSGISYKRGSFSHFTMNGLLLDGYTPYRWQTVGGKDNKRHLNRGFSDHLPISLWLTSDYQEWPGNEGAPEGSFETGRDGWVVRSPHFTAVLSSEQAFDGKSSLLITGQGKKNGTMLSLTAILPDRKKASLKIGGEGEFALRIRKNGSKEWYYLVGNKLSGSGQKAYTKVLNNKWMQLDIPLHPFNVGDTVNVEIRYRGMIRQRLFIDDSSLSGWFRAQEIPARFSPL